MKVDESKMKEFEAMTDVSSATLIPQ